MGTRAIAEEILAGISGWVAIESPTHDAGAVNRMMDRAAADFAAFGAHVERICGQGAFADHLSVRSPWGGDGPGILVLCHLDTVHPVGTLDGPLPFRVVGNKAYGPGIYDMKGGAYLALAALREIARAGRVTPLPIRLLYVSDEEVGSPSSRPLIEAAANLARYVLVTEPARDGGKVVTARKGVGRYELIVRGRPAHAGSRHQDGRSAILEMAHQVLAIEALTDYTRGITFNVGRIEGGTADNVVPAHCRATIDMRVPTLEAAIEMESRLRSLAPVAADVRLELTGRLNRPPYEKNDGVAGLFERARTLAAEIDLDLRDVATGGGSDGNFVAHRVPTLDGLGVDGDGAHTLEEHCLLSSLVPRMLLLKRLFETLD